MFCSAAPGVVNLGGAEICFQTRFIVTNLDNKKQTRLDSGLSVHPILVHTHINICPIHHRILYCAWDAKGDTDKWFAEA